MVGLLYIVNWKEFLLGCHKQFGCTGSFSLLRVTKITSVCLLCRESGGTVTVDLLMIRNEYLCVEISDICECLNVDCGFRVLFGWFMLYLTHLPPVYGSLSRKALR